MLCTQSLNYRLFRSDVLDFLDGEIVQHTLDEMIFLRRSKYCAGEMVVMMTTLSKR
jgi:hypothetical protein